MAKCAACGRFITTKGGATCCNLSCNNRFHLACLLLPDTAQISSSWQCPDCRKKVPKGDNSATPVKELSGDPSLPVAVSAPVAEVQTTPSEGEHREEGEPSPGSQLTLREEIRLFRSELREVRDELRNFRREMAELNSSLGICTKRVDGLEGRIEALENKHIGENQDDKINQLEHTVMRLQLDLNDRDQELLSSDLEISNIPEIPGEDVMNTVGLVAAKLGVTLTDREIVFAQRVGPKLEREVRTGAADKESLAGGKVADVRGRRIVVRLTRRALRDDLLQSARVRRGATTADLGLSATPRRFYLNERLTKTNKFLFYRVREAGSRLGWKYTWTKFGRILAKQGDGKQTYCIRTEEDLVRVFGREVATDREA